ncbi:unnamed protein product [Prorocentrum cordatum]|uniref:Uncharacterized protein n=1 Tax=Prorocentrum cordatum TaxID=2364126 RepID=A0ABN9VTU8_9DINO|nr:unnamed protein product [Polarella glacialis]
MVAGVISELDQTSTLLSDRRVPWPPLNDSWLSEEVQAARRLTTTFDASWALSDAVFGIWPRAVAKVVGVDIMQVSIEGIRDVEAAARRLRSRGGGASEASLVDGVGRRLTSSFSAAITVDAAVAIYPVDDVELIKARAILLASEVSAEFNIFLTEVSEQLAKVGIDAEPFVRNLVLASSTPVELANIPILQANWAVVSEWTMCSNLCGWGVRFRTVECNINEYLCNANKPATFLDHVRVLEGELTYPLNDSFNDWEEGYVMPGQKIYLPTVAECQWYSECDFMIMCPFGPDLENGFEACEAQFTLASASYGGFAGAVVLFWCVYCCRKCRTPTGGRHRLYVAKGLRRRKQKLDVQWKRVKKGRGVVREVAKCEPGKSKRSKVRIVWDVDVHRVQQYMSKRRDSKAESEAGSESETSLASHILAERIYLSGEDGSFFVHCRLRTGNPEGFIFGKAFPAADPGDDPMCTAKVLIMREGLLVFQMGAEELVGVTRLNDVSWHEVGLMYIQEHNVYALVVDGEEEARGLQGMADHSATAWLIGRPVQQDLAMGTLRTELRNLGVSVDMLETEYQEHPFFDGDIDTFK